jgi:soluble lytic murein transglycosylase-like protein
VPAIVAPHRPPYHASTFSRGCAVTLPQKSVPMFFAVAFASTLFTLAPGDAYAPEQLAPELLACAPDGDEAVALTPDPSQTVLARYLARRFLIASEATERMVQAAYGAAREVGLDPLLVLAVISVESRFNPIAESGMGAKGLMQIIPRYHQAKILPLGGDAALWDPEANIRLGALILQEYVYRTGTVEAGLQYYNGAFWDGTAQYAQKVMAERARLMEVVQQTDGV